MIIFSDRARTEALLDYFKNGGETHILLTCRDANNQQVFIRDDDIVSNGGVTVSTVLNPDTNLKFGQAVSTEVVAYIIKSAKTDSIDWSKPIDVYVSHQLPGEQRNYFSICSVFSTKQQITYVDGMDVIVMTAYDYMQKFDVVANDFIDSLTFPTYFIYIYRNLLAYVGITNGAAEILPPIDLTFNTNPFPYGCTLRDILRWLMEFAGGYARMGHRGNTDKIIPTRIQRPGFSIEHILTRDNYYELNKSGVVVPSVPAVELIETQSIEHTSYPATYTGQPYIIMDNPIFSLCTDAQKLECLQAYKENYLDFDAPNDAYIPMRVTTPGNPLVEVGDIIDVVDADNNTLPLRIFSRVFHWDGACTDTYECTGEPEWNMTEQERATYSTDGRIEAIMAVKKDKQEAVTDPTASGTAVQFISSIEQNEQGVITPLKKTVRTASRGNAGLCPAMPSGSGTSKFLREDGSWAIPVKSLGTANDSTKTINFSGNVEFLLIVNSLSDNRNAMFICYGRSGNSCSATQVYCGSNITVTTDTGKIKVKNSASYDAKIYALILSGDASDMS